MKKALPILLLLLLVGAQTPLTAQAEDPMPFVPDSIYEPSARAAFAAARYWDGFDFQDTACVKGDYSEAAFANFLGLLAYSSAEGRDTAIARWLSKPGQNTVSLSHFSDLSDRYLHQQDSPLRNDSLYLLILQHLATTTDAATSSRAAFRLQQLASNQPGTIAADFAYSAPDGTTRSLHATAPDRLMLLLFYDPDCEQCRTLLFRLRHHSLLNQLVAQARLTVLAVCTEGTSPGELPATWLSVVPDTTHPLPYNLEDLPSLYQLSPQKHILLRDPTPQELTQFLISY